MADEISINLGVRIVKDEYSATVDERFTDDFVIGEGGGVQEIGTTEEALVFGDVAVEGWLYLKNVDATNLIDFGPDDSGMVIIGRLYPGEACLLRLLPGVTVKAKANAAAADLHVRCFRGST